MQNRDDRELERAVGSVLPALLLLVLAVALTFADPGDLDAQDLAPVPATSAVASDEDVAWPCEPGDLDCDGDVDVRDVMLVVKHWGKEYDYGK